MELLLRNRSSLISVLVILVVIALLLNGMSAPAAASVLLSGVTLAALYFLVASGVSLIFGLMDVLNFAHGSLFMIGAYAGWTFYTNPRLIFNTAPLALMVIAGVSFGNLFTARVSVGRWARWIAALAALAILVLALRDLPIDRLVAMGTSMTGKVIPTAEAEEPVAAMLWRIGIAFFAGIAASFAMRSPREQPSSRFAARAAAPAVAFAIIALAMLFGRDICEQLILGTESDVRFGFALAFGATTGALIGALMEWGLIRPLYARPIYQILLTLGLVFVFDQIVRQVYGPAGAFMDMPSFFASSGKDCPSPNVISWLSEHCDSISVLGRPFPSYRLFIIVIGIVILLAIVLILQRSRLGMIIRAGVQDSEMVEALGINVRRVFTLVFALGAGLAGLGGVVAAPFLGVYPDMALEFLLQAFIVVVIGGLGSVPGAAVGALLVGLARAYGDNIVLAGIHMPWMTDSISGSPAIARASTVLIMAIVLFIKPTGIFGKKE